MKKDECGNILCDGTDCLLVAVESLVESKEIPKWRHPKSYLGQRMFEECLTVNYCEVHRKIAHRTAMTPLQR